MNRPAPTLTLQKGTPLVLVGPQGCGKTTLAEQVAQRYGSFVSTDVDMLESDDGVAEALGQQPSTWIVDGLPRSINAAARLKALITRQTVKVRPMYGKTILDLKTPRFIFCTSEANALDHLGSRRFTVYRMDGGAA